MKFEFNDDSQKICNSADVVNYGIQCDICGNKFQSVSNINGKRYCAGCYYKTFMKDNQQAEITQLKQQLIEKDKEIKKLNWQLKDKDFIIKNLNHSLSVAPNANAGQRARIDELTKIVKEKDKEINSLIVDYEKRISQEQELMSNMEHLLTEKQNAIDEINKEFVQAVHDWKTLCAEKDKEIERLKVFEKAYYFNQLQASQEDIQQFQQLANQSAVNINHIAITELEKVKEKINKLPITDILDTDYGGFKKIYQTDAIRIIDQQINELKGE